VGGKRTLLEAITPSIVNRRPVSLAKLQASKKSSFFPSPQSQNNQKEFNCRSSQCQVIGDFLFSFTIKLFGL
jgi:hypothetical protein